MNWKLKYWTLLINQSINGSETQGIKRDILLTNLGMKRDKEQNQMQKHNNVII